MRKMKKIVIAITFIFIILLLSFNTSYAAVIESKDSNGTVLTGGTISDFYVMGEGLKGTGQGLEGTSVDVKMANNYEWALVSYFSNSAYGTGGTGQNTGIANVNTGVKKHKSTNGNVTGVMDWGNTYTFTAGIISDYASKTLTTAGNLTLDSSTSSIVNAAGTGNRVDKFGNLAYNGDIAQTGWYSSWNYYGNNANYPYSVRSGLFGFNGGSNGNGLASGAARADTTFRAVFYAQ